MRKEEEIATMADAMWPNNSGGLAKAGKLCEEAGEFMGQEVRLVENGGRYSREGHFAELLDVVTVVAQLAVRFDYSLGELLEMAHQAVSAKHRKWMELQGIAIPIHDSNGRHVASATYAQPDWFAGAEVPAKCAWCHKLLGLDRKKGESFWPFDEDETKRICEKLNWHGD